MTKNKKVFYKVLTVKVNGNRSLISGMGSHREFSSLANMSYECDKWLVAPYNSRFFLFETVAQARAFMQGNTPTSGHKHVMFRAKVKGGYALKCRGICGLDYASSSSSQRYHAFWNAFNTCLKRKRKAVDACRIAAEEVKTTITPYDSVFARCIKILPGEVYSYEQE